MIDYKHINTTPRRRRSERIKVAVFLVGFVALMGLVGKYEQEIEPAEVAAAVEPAMQAKIETILPETDCETEKKGKGVLKCGNQMTLTK